MNGVGSEPVVSGQVLTWTLNGVGPGDSFEILFRASVDDCGDFRNVVNVTGEFCEGVVYAEDYAWVHVTGCDVDYELSVDKLVKWDCVGLYDDDISFDIGDYDWVTFKLLVHLVDDFDSVVVKDTVIDLQSG